MTPQLHLSLEFLSQSRELLPVRIILTLGAMRTHSLLNGPLSDLFIGKQEFLGSTTFLTLHRNVLIEVLAYLACLLVLADLEHGLVPPLDDQLFLPRPLDLPVDHVHHIMHPLTVWSRI